MAFHKSSVTSGRPRAVAGIFAPYPANAVCFLCTRSHSNHWRLAASPSSRVLSGVRSSCHGNITVKYFHWPLGRPRYPRAQYSAHSAAGEGESAHLGSGADDKQQLLTSVWWNSRGAPRRTPSGRKREATSSPLPTSPVSSPPRFVSATVKASQVFAAERKRSARRLIRLGEV